MFIHLCTQPTIIKLNQQEIWRCEQGNTELIRKVVYEFNWWRTFSNLNINESVCPFNKTILNIASNFMPNEMVTCNDREILE